MKYGTAKGFEIWKYMATLTALIAHPPRLGLQLGLAEINGFMTYGFVLTCWM